MDELISLANIDYLLEQLKKDRLTAGKRAEAMKLLISEEDKLGRSLEQLELAFSRIRKGEELVSRIRQLRDRFAPCSKARTQAERLLTTSEETQALLQSAYRNLRARYAQNGLVASSHLTGQPGAGRGRRKPHTETMN
jgi:hypothetical protein